MNKQLIDEINEELRHAGQDIEKAELLQQLAKRLITPDTVIQPMEFLFEMSGKPCFPRGELVGITGKAKSGKTYLSSLLMTLCFQRTVMGMRRLRDEQLKVLWIDTEQSEESTQDILRNRIQPMMCGACDSEWYERNLQIQEFPSEMFQVFNLRGEIWQQRLPLLETAIEQQKPDLVILDGIRDLVNDINDGVMAQDVIERLMKMASQTKCCIVCILHQNKNAEDKNLRGFLGTELRNKAFEVYECVKSPDRVFSVKQTDTRKYDITEKLQYTVRQDGIPRLTPT